MSLPLKVRRNSSCCLSKRFASGASFGKVYVLSAFVAMANMLVRWVLFVLGWISATMDGILVHLLVAQRHGISRSDNVD